jgi:hypothetical protein
VIIIKELEPASKQPDNRSRLLSVQFSCFSRKERERERESFHRQCFCFVLMPSLPQ